jgi:hypothetical protein
MALKDFVDQQVTKGLNKSEIEANLKLNGYTQEEITQATAHLPVGYDFSQVNQQANYEPATTPQSSANVKSIMFGILFICLGLFRLTAGRGETLSVIIGLILIGSGIFKVISGFSGK